MAAKPTTLSIAKIGAPGQPKQLKISLEPGLAAELDRYADAYEANYGERADVETLIPHILAGFISADRGFKKWKADQGRKPADAE